MSSVQERLDRQLLNACRYGHVSEVDILLDKGANIAYSDEDDPFGATCLSEASRRGKAEIVQLLIQKGVSVNDKISHDITALHLACERGHIQVVQVLLNNQCEACPQELFNLDTPLHYAAANDHDAICQLLVEKGKVDVNIQNRTGDTPLHTAVANDRAKSSTMLLRLNADLSITNHAEMTPLIVAQIAKCKQAMEAMQPFLARLQEAEQNKKQEEKNKFNASRKHTIRKTLDNSSIPNLSNLALQDSMEESKYDSADEEYHQHSKQRAHTPAHRLMSGKRDVVFKKGFLQKQGKKFKHFHERYFILWSNGLLHYYAKEHTVFANYVEKSKQGGKHSSGDDQASMARSQSHNDRDIHLKPGNSTPVKQSNTNKISDDSSMAFDSEDEAPPNDEQQNHSFPSLPRSKSNSKENLKEADNKRKKGKAAQHMKRKSTFARLGLKSETIKPKGMIDINDLVETQFLEFTDNSPGWALITPEREWKFKCKSDRERREWIAAVHAVNYGISPYDFQNAYDMNISYKHNTMLLEPSTNSFLSSANGGNNASAVDERSSAIAQGWMYKLGAAVRGLEQNYWKKRWVSLYKKPARLAYAAHPYSLSDLDANGSVSPRSSIQSSSNKNEKLVDAEHPHHNQGSHKEHAQMNGHAAGKNGRKYTKHRKKGSNILKGLIQLNDVTNIIRIGDSEIIKDVYKAPTVHVFALITPKRTWVFACKTAEECNMWFERIAFFLPDQWMANNNGQKVNVEELLRFNRVKTIANEHDGKHVQQNSNDSEDDAKQSQNKKQHLNVNGAKRKKKGKNNKDGDDTVMTKLLRKVSNVAESLGITEQYSTISGVQPKGTITDYNDAISMMHDDNNEQDNSMLDDDDDDADED